MLLLGLILVVALMIPIVAILIDSPVGRALGRRLEGSGDGAGANVQQLQRKVEVLETDVEDLTRQLTGLRDEVQFVQRLLDDPNRKKKSS
ncbi:MAG TPA: hypothetical protein VI139_06175 [Gemmatimonadales bacterium]